MRSFWMVRDSRNLRNIFMHKIGSRLCCSLAALLAVLSSISVGFAQEEVYQIEHIGIFNTLRKPAVEFPHEMHVEALEDAGCGACHHAPDPVTGKLTYEEDEEAGCVECHASKAQGNIPGLREAFHGSCTVCHRRLRHDKDSTGGPTTCGECHNME